MTAVRRSD